MRRAGIPAGLTLNRFARPATADLWSVSHEQDLVPGVLQAGVALLQVLLGTGDEVVFVGSFKELSTWAQQPGQHETPLAKTAVWAAEWHGNLAREPVRSTGSTSLSIIGAINHSWNRGARVEDKTIGKLPRHAGINTQPSVYTEGNHQAAKARHSGDSVCIPMSGDTPMLDSTPLSFRIAL